MEAHFATVWESIAATVPEHLALVQGARRLSWAAFEERAARVADVFTEAGGGKNGKGATVLHNCSEYDEGVFASFKIRAVPVNVNYRYLQDELAYVIDNADAEAVVFHGSLGERIAGTRAKCPRVKIWVEVKDSGDHLEGSEPYERMLCTADIAPPIRRSEQDFSLLYTGGTTGRPKAVVYSVGQLVRTFMQRMAPLVGLDALDRPEEAPVVAHRLVEENAAYVALPACPLMHAAGWWAGLMAPHVLGGTSVLLEGRWFSPAEMWSVIERERVVAAIIVGDSFARPMVRELGERMMTPDVPRFRRLISSGAMFAASTKRDLLARLPELTIIDTVGASEGVIGNEITDRETPVQTARFHIHPTTRVFTEDWQEVGPGSGIPGLLAVGGNVPLGYYKDSVKSAATFREIGGIRYAIPGDWALLEEDGSITLLGRGNQCINTAGEKVFPEEVEEALKTHPDVEDALVFGMLDALLGQMVAAVVGLHGGGMSSEQELIRYVRTQLASYKAPRSIHLVDVVPRTATGTADDGADRALLSEEAVRR